MTDRNAILEEAASPASSAAQGETAVIKAAEVLNRYNVEVAQTTARQHADVLYRDYMSPLKAALDVALQGLYEARLPATPLPSPTPVQEREEE